VLHSTASCTLKAESGRYTANNTHIKRTHLSFFFVVVRVYMRINCLLHIGVLGAGKFDSFPTIFTSPTTLAGVNLEAAIRRRSKAVGASACVIRPPLKKSS